MQFDELKHVKGQRDRAFAALKGVMELIDNGDLCRDISRDHEAMWPMRMMGLVQRLKTAQEVVAEQIGGLDNLRPDGQ
jgi:hypothetical protein